MKLAFIVLLLAFTGVATRSTSKDRAPTVVGYPYDDETILELYDENGIEENPTATTSTTPKLEYHSTQNRYLWLTRQNSTMLMTTSTIKAESDEHLKDVRKFFKKVFEDFRKLLKNITGHDIIGAIIQLFKKKTDETVDNS